MIITIYWADLSVDGQNALKDDGFTPTSQQLIGDTPIGVFTDEMNDNGGPVI